jgi:hypothetical protein
VTAQARTAIDDRLAAPLGTPRALFCLALKVRLATDAGALDPVLSGRLSTEVKPRSPPRPRTTRQG